jgi:hypothetical protein
MTARAIVLLALLSVGCDSASCRCHNGYYETSYHEGCADGSGDELVCRERMQVAAAHGRSSVRLRVHSW